jgi:hypothetical protein
MTATRNQMIKLQIQACIQTRNQKQKQCQSDVRLEKAQVACVQTQNKKKLECEIMRNKIERLKERVKKLKRKVKKLKEKLRERVEDEEIHESVMGLCEEQHVNKVVEEVKLVLPLLSNNFELCFFNLKKVKYMIRLLLIEFIDFVVEVAPSISTLNWKRESQTNINTLPINFPINYGVFLTLFWFVHYSTFSLLFCFFSLYP